MKYEAPVGELHESHPEMGEKAEHNKPKRKKRPEADITRQIQDWANTVKASRSMLLAVQLNQKGEPAIAPTWLVKQVDATSSVLKARAEILDSVIERMVDEQIIVSGHNSIANEWRRKLLCWYEGLTDEEKQAIPVFGNTISTRKCLNNVPGMRNLNESPLVS